MKTNVLGVQYDNVTMAEALDTARELLLVWYFDVELQYMWYRPEKLHLER